MANKPPKREKSTLEKIPLRKLAAGLKKQLKSKLDDIDPDWKSGKPKRD